MTRGEQFILLAMVVIIAIAFMLLAGLAENAMVGIR